MMEENITTVEGESASLYCDIDANPRENLTVTWSHDSNILEEDSERFMTETSEDGSFSVLTILETHRQDAGLYSCAVENVVGVGYSESTTTLDILCKSTISWCISMTLPICRRAWCVRGAGARGCV